VNPLVQRLGWMLIHSLWEDVLIWCVLQVVLLALARRSPQARYLSACIALLAMAGLPWLTFDISDLFARLAQSHAAVSGTVVAPSTVPLHTTFSTWILSPEAGSDVSVFPAPVSSRLSDLIPFLVAIWAVGLALSSTRLWLRWRSVQSLIRQPFGPLDAAWVKRFEQLRRLSGVVRVVRLGETAAVSVPIVAGWLKPVILLPLGVMTSMPADQVEAILLHELAHICRQDYLVNLLQSVVETLFFYHPAVWSVNRRIRLERELACDDQTTQWCRSPRTYAEALAGFEAFRAQAPLLAASGEGDLLRRIQRILFGPQPENRSVGIFAAAGLCGIGVYLVSMLLVPVLAEHVMTSQERVTEIQALQQPPLLESPYTPSENVYVSGTIKTEDGQPLPKDLIDRRASLKKAGSLLSSWRNGTSSSGSIYIYPKDQTFSGNTQSGRIGIAVWAEGYAPLRMVGLQPKDGQLKVNLVLKRGFPAQVKIIGSNGEPLKDAVLNATSSHLGEPLDVSMPPVQTDASGLATFGRVEADSEIHLMAAKPGWQMAYQVVSHWQDGRPLVWKLEPAVTTLGLVIDQATRKPIPDAEIILAARRATGESNYSANAPETGQLLGHSESTGRFDLDNLSASYNYRIYIRAAGYQTTVFPIDYGEKNRICELPSGLHIHGEIIDPTGKFKSVILPVRLECSYYIQATPFNGYGQNREQTFSKLGAKTSFSFDDLPEGPLDLRLAPQGFADHEYEINLKKNLDDYVIDLSANSEPNISDKPDPRPLRTIQITLRPVVGTPPTGALDSRYEVVGNRGNYQTFKTLPIANGKATAQIPIPNRITLIADHLIGYWFPSQSFDLPAGKEPFVHTVSVQPAGVMHGHVAVPPSFKGRYLAASPIALKKAPGITADLTGEFYDGQLVKNNYVTPPLPFGGTYAVVVDAAPSYFVSPATMVDPAHPLVVRDMDLSVQQGTLTGKFVDENGKPISYEEVMLTYHPTPYDTFVSHSATTSGDGSFTISQINFAVPGNYEVQLYSKDWALTALRIDSHTPQPVVIPLRRAAQ
jgi:beta-lactamase regulating signal transducer with metallopeptidase domain